MKRNVKITIAAAVLFVVGMAYRSHVNGFVRETVGGATRLAGDTVRGTVGFVRNTTTGVLSGGRARRNARRDKDDDNNGRSRQSRKNR